MPRLDILIAQVDPLDLARTAPQQGPGLSRELLFVLAAILALGAILFFWAYWTRRDPRRKAENGARVLYRSANKAEGKVKMRRRRSRHPENLPRNPTLAEAGGLPPVREEPAESA